MKTFTKFLVCLLIVPFAASLTLHAEDEIPNDEIWYTSTDGNVVTPYNSGVFGANIVSNTYMSGKGVIKFDGDVTRIGQEAFYGCSSLASITIPNSVTSIGTWAFQGCSSLPIENNIRYADTYLIEAVDKTLLSYSIKEDTKWIGNNAFKDCSNLLAITIPNLVTRIGSSAFSGCSSLRMIILSYLMH